MKDLHFGFIMDGNRRFAKLKNISFEKAYTLGAKNFFNYIKYQIEFKIKETTFFALSKENLKRENSELKTLEKVFEDFSKREDIEKFLIKNKVKIRIIRTEKIRLRKNFLEEYEILSSRIKEPSFFVNVCLGYSGREEILLALNKIVSKEINKKITQKIIKENLLFDKKTKDLDLIVRYGRVQRLSGFCLFLSSYSELYFPKKLWPSVSKKDFLKALEFYQSQKRNFGK